MRLCKRGHQKTVENTRKSGACRICDVDYRARNRDALRAKSRAYYWRTRERFKLNVRNYRLRRHYGVDLRWYDEQFAKQGGVCAICRRPQQEGIKSLAVDHDHLSGKPRGLLCRACNRGLGVFDDNTERLRAAAAYLEAYTYG